MAQSVLGGLFGPPVKQYDPAQEWAQADSGQRFNESTYRAGQGLGQAIGGMTGVDARPDAEKRRVALEQIKQQLAQSGAEPGSDEYYKQFAIALQRGGFPEEALAIGQQWNAQKSATAKEALAVTAETRKSREGEVKATNDTIRANRYGSPFMQKLDALTNLSKQLATVDPQAPQYNALQQQYEAILASLEKDTTTGRKIKVIDRNDSQEIVDAESGDTIRVIPKGAVPLTTKDIHKEEKTAQAAESAYAAVMQKWQSNYDSAVKLYNHPGLDGFVGRITGATGEGGVDKRGMVREAMISALSPAAREARALFQQVQGGSFLGGLAELKAASPQGSTGLGAVSEIEGAKVQAAKAALDPRQDSASFRRQLATYVQDIENSASLVSAAAQRDQIAPIAMRPTPLTGAPGARPARPAPVAKPAAAAPAGKWTFKTLD